MVVEEEPEGLGERGRGRASLRRVSYLCCVVGTTANRSMRLGACSRVGPEVAVVTCLELVAPVAHRPSCLP